MYTQLIQPPTHPPLQESNDCKTLLTLMGVPFLDAPCEAEAQCASLAKVNNPPTHPNLFSSFSSSTHNPSISIQDLIQTVFFPSFTHTD